MKKIMVGLNITAVFAVLVAIGLVVYVRFGGAKTVEPDSLVSTSVTPSITQIASTSEPAAPSETQSSPAETDPGPSQVPDAPATDKQPDEDEPEDLPVFQSVENELGMSITYNGEETWLSTLTMAGGRYYVNLLEVENRTGKTAADKELFNPQLDGLISLIDAAECLNLSISIDSQAKTMDIYDAKVIQPSPADREGDAYIRLEDIMADSPDGREGSFTDSDLEKLRALADYMYDNGQKYYIAWIPLYVNPPEGIVNDVTTDHTLYNANFIYTLDYMIIRGGRIGLHGYSHQENDEESAVGNEFGGTSPYTLAEMRERMEKAQAAADTLGYEVYFFEFPHYSCLESSLAIAMEYWDVIYQYQPFIDVKTGSIKTTDMADGRIVRFIPTPADYVYSVYDGDGIVARLNNHGSSIVSLFFHPRLDYHAISYRVVDGERTYYYDESGILTRIIATIHELGYEFRYF